MLRARWAVVLLLLGVLMTVLSLVPVGELQLNALALVAAGGLFVVGGTLALANARRLLEEAMAERTARLDEAEARYRRLVEELPIVTYVDAIDDTSSTIFISPQIEHMLGYSVEEWMNDSDLWVKLLHPDDRERVIAENIRTNATAEPFRMEYRLFAKDGREVWFLDEAIFELDADGKPLFCRGYMQDITERKTLELRLATAFHDSITGLPNRALFSDRVLNAVARHHRTGDGLAVLFLDLDDFKTVNDSLGHPGGDEVLGQAGARVRGCLRPGDTAARLGGDEFAVLVDECADPDAAAAVARRIAAAFKEPFVVGEREAFVSVSLGVAFRLDGETADEMLRNADVAMYRAKARGKGRIEIYEPSMRERALERLQLTTELQRAMQRGELELEYQPIVAVATGGLAGAEALVRWRHPERGLISSSEFIALAEETGLIVPLGRFVLERACQSAAAWSDPAGRPLRSFISVNLSLRELQEADVVPTIERILDRTGLDPGRLVLEVTETVLMIERDEIVPRLQALGRMGVRLAIDDFGTGYSSLGYLNELPVDIIKIAKPFVDALDAPGDDGLARAIIGIGSALGLSAVAEGVETELQVQRLRALRCDYAQGFYFARPGAEGEVVELLERSALRVA
jgi:diguanylate cyclase (GGDEF)-like protein/PAS domain S-box-containing protein